MASTDQPFRLTLYLITGEAHSFPVFIDAAKTGVQNATAWRDPPFDAGVLAKIEDREWLFALTIRMYTHLIRRNNTDGAFFMTDDLGKGWGIPARNIVALRLEDPSRPADKPVVGFGSAIQRAGEQDLG